MATNRFDTVMSSNTLGQVPLMSLPFDQLDALLAQNQAKKDLFDERSEIDFDFIQQNEFDVNARKQIEDYRNKVKTQLSDIAAKGDTQGYLAGLSQATKNISSLFKAGGLANTLQERFNSVQAGMKELKDKRTKDDGYGRLNYLHDLENFKNQYTTAALNYDPVNRTAGQIGEAQITPFTDIKKGLLEQVKAIDPDMTEQDILSGAWIKRVKDKGVDPQRIQNIFDSYMSSPEVRQQMGVERWSLNKQIDRDAFVTGVNKNRQSINKNIDDTTTKIGDLLASGKRDDIKAAQSFLNEQGFSVGKADGITGKKTKAAFEKYKDELTKRKKEILKNPDDKQINSLLNDRLTADYDKYFKGFFGQEHSETMKANPFALAKFKAKLKAKAEEEAFINKTYKTDIQSHGEYKNPYESVRDSWTKTETFDTGRGIATRSSVDKSIDPKVKYQEMIDEIKSGGDLAQLGNTKEIWDKYGEHIEASTSNPKELIAKLEAIDQQINAVRSNNDYFINRPSSEKALKVVADNAIKYSLPSATSFTILDAAGTGNGDVIGTKELFEKLGVESIKDLKEKSSFVGTTHPAGGTAIKGTVYKYTADDGTHFQFVGGTESLEEASEFAPIRAANEVLYNPNVKKGRTFMLGNIPAYTKIDYITESTQYEDTIQGLTEQAGNATTKEQREAIDKQIDELEHKMSKLPFGGKGNIIGHYPAYYNAQTNELLRPMDRGQLHNIHTEQFVK